MVYHIDKYEVCHNNLVVSNGLHWLCQFWGWRVRIKLWWQERVGLPMVRTAKGRGEQLEEEGPSQWPDVSAWFIHLSHRRWSSREPGKIGPALGTEVKKILHQIFGDEIFGNCCTCLALCYCGGSTKKCIYRWRTWHKIIKLFLKESLINIFSLSSDCLIWHWTFTILGRKKEKNLGKS